MVGESPRRQGPSGLAVAGNFAIRPCYSTQLFNRDGFGQIARLIDIAIATASDVIGVAL